MGNASANESNTDGENTTGGENTTDGENTPDGENPTGGGSMPGSVGEAMSTGQLAAVGGIVQDSALAVVRLPLATGRVSVVGVGVVAVALGGLVAALSMRRGRSHSPVSMEDSLLVE